MAVKALGSALFGASLVFLTQEAGATPVVGTDSFQDNGPANNGLTFSGHFANGGNINLNLTSGVADNISNFLTIKSNDTNFFGGNTQDTIAVNFAFTQPGVGGGTLSGTGTEVSGIIDSSGSVTWNDPLTVNFVDGSALTISLSNTTFGGLFQLNDTVQVDATFTYTGSSGGSTAVPEPASLALLGNGLMGAAFVGWRRKHAWSEHKLPRRTRRTTTFWHSSEMGSRSVYSGISLGTPLAPSNLSSFAMFMPRDS